MNDVQNVESTTNIDIIIVMKNFSHYVIGNISEGQKFCWEIQTHICWSLVVVYNVETIQFTINIIIKTSCELIVVFVSIKEYYCQQQATQKKRRTSEKTLQGKKLCLQAFLWTRHGIMHKNNYEQAHISILKCCGLLECIFMMFIEMRLQVNYVFWQPNKILLLRLRSLNLQTIM